MEEETTSSEHPARTTLQDQIAQRLQQALNGLENVPADFIPEVSPATDPKFGHYQTNAAMVLAKQLRRPPRELAARILETFHPDGLVAPPDIAGAGFINFRLLPEALAERLNSMLPDPRLGVAPAARPRRIVIDFSAPNVAKPMHVGHIRSTIIGDALARTARFLGHHVITDNHVGDWGTQFGMIIYGWKHFLDRKALEGFPLDELVRVYRKVNAAANEDEGIRDTCRHELVKLQQGDAENLAIWRETVDISMREFQRMYERLDIHFDHQLGESFYNPRLDPLVEGLLEEGLAEWSEHAVCVFFPDHPELHDKPCLIRKRDGGYLYATTDLATIDYRVQNWHPDEIWYVTGAPQQLHFKQVFEVTRRRGIHVKLVHVPFGSILGEDRKLMKTRSGDNVQLSDVLFEACERALKIVAAKNPKLPRAEQEEIAEMIGIGAVKYAELSQHRMTDYVFSWDKMLSFQGNTAPYLQNAYVRIRSIFRKLNEDYQPAEVSPAALEDEASQALAVHLAGLAEIVPLVLDDFRPNLLAHYLYELANTFHRFYEACPVLKAEEPLRQSRLALCYLTAGVLRHGMDLLGIRLPDRM